MPINLILWQLECTSLWGKSTNLKPWDFVKRAQKEMTCEILETYGVVKYFYGFMLSPSDQANN